MNKIGVCEWSLPVNGPFALDFAANVGFQGIQLGDLGGSQMGYPMMNAFIREGYKEASARTGVELHSMHLFTMVRDGGHIFPMHSPASDLAIESIHNGIDSCEAMGIDCLNISAFFQSDVKNDYDWDNLIAHLSYACAYAKDHGIHVAFEPGVDMTKIKDLIDRVPDITINYDLTNPMGTGIGDPMEEIKQLGSAIIDHVHVKDSTRDAFGRFAAPCFSGDGFGKLQDSIGLLQQLGFDKWYLSEGDYFNPLPHGVGPDISAVARTDFEKIRDLVQNAQVK